MSLHVRCTTACLVAAVMACSRPSPDGRAGDSSSTWRAMETAQGASPSASSGDWTLTEEGFGPLRAGMTPQQAATVVPGSFLIPAGSDSTGCDYAAWTAAPPGVKVMLDGGVVARVDVDSGRTATAEGARIGDSEARIDSLYAGRVRRLPHKYTDGRYLIVLAPAARDTLLRFVFETDGARVTTYRSGRFPAVEYVEGCS